MDELQNQLLCSTGEHVQRLERRVLLLLPGRVSDGARDEAADAGSDVPRRHHAGVHLTWDHHRQT